MDQDTLQSMADRLIAAWNAQDVEALLACYSTDVEYRDPNTRGAVRGHDALRRYLTRLFASWRMHWSVRSTHLFEDGSGCAARWHATFQRQGEAASIGIDGMDFVEVRDGRVTRNEVWFDRAQLMALAA